MEINDSELKDKIENGEKVIVDFWAKFCGPCKVMKPVFDKISQEYSDNNHDVQLYTMDVEENREFAVSLGIRAVPTIKGFSNNKEVFSQPGAKDEKQIKDIIELVVNG